MSDIDPDPAMAVVVTAALLDAGRVAAAIGHGSGWPLWSLLFGLAINNFDPKHSGNIVNNMA